MKKVLGFTAIALVAAGLLASCGTTAEKPATPTATPATTAPAYRIIMNQNSDFGGQVPDWVTKTIYQLESSDEYKDFYVFKVDRVGQNLQALKLMVSGADAATEVARYVSMRVASLFASSEVGDDKKLETYMENVVKNYAKANISTFRRAGDFWVQREYTADKRTEYAYYAFFTVDKVQLKKLIGDAVNDAPDSPEKTTAKQRVQALMEKGLPAMDE